uniref:Ig-like domain-containing protein n=1 Tax=Maylandia zebra TaxID=106582 RepID=A0A3P9ATY1_9CICH
MFTITLSPTEKPFQSVNWNVNVSTTIVVMINPEETIAPEYEGRITFFPSTASFELRSLTLDDTGEYTVKIIQDGKTQTVTNAYFLLLYFSFTESVSNILITSKTDLVEFNSSVTLSCAASGSSLSFLWYNGSSEVTQCSCVKYFCDFTRKTEFNILLHFSSTQRNFSMSPLHLDGPENINLILSPPQGYFAVGSDISFTCSVGSRPPAQFNWFLNGDQLLDTGSELRLMNVNMSNSGNYSCQAFNSKTLRSQTSQPSAITVLGNLKVSGTFKFNIIRLDF